jgi:hypothetical protein
MPDTYAVRLATLACVSLLALSCGRSAPQVTIEFSGPPGSGEPDLFAADDGRVLMSWFEQVDDTAYVLNVAQRVDGRWGPAHVVEQGSQFFVNWADFPAVTELADGTWAVHWLEKVSRDPYAYHVKVVVSHDQGRTWSDPVVPHGDRSPTEHGFVSMVPWKDGAALIWLDGRAMRGTTGDMTVRTTTLTAEGNVAEDVLLDGRACECCTTALVRTARGLLAAYRDRSPDEIRDIAVVRYERARWSEPVFVSQDRWHIAACPVNGPQLAAAGDTIVVAWFTAANETPRVQIAFSRDGGRSFAPPIRVDDGLPRGRVDVGLDQEGRTAVVTWLEVTTSGAEIRARTVHPDGSVEPSWIVGQTGDERASGFPRMVRAGSEIVFAWTVPGAAGGVRVGVVGGGR